ncbi:Prostaglandin D2 receptor [Fukomys damarensis]|uniref:Prostaglandin D2 receptor n=1 Tax=Fukomys damarensis TaxID=885580 RepID=A0A091E3U0_FUKDA|nr:Prostaglandin D2 receptor [Fukomys damarensis]
MQGPPVRINAFGSGETLGRPRTRRMRCPPLGVWGGASRAGTRWGIWPFAGRPRPSELPSKAAAERPSVFYVLVCGLTVTDLLGKCLLSPVVLAAYAQNRSLRGLPPAQGKSLCQTFAFFMSFFGLASTLQLLAMALECWLSLGHPFFYQRHITLRRGALVAPVVGAFSLAFCSLPFVGFGDFVQYCPGTWCFIQMVSGDGSLSVQAYSVLYSSLVALLYRAYYGAFKAVQEEPDDLLALRFLSVISIVDPWIFIIFRTSVFRMFFHKIFIRPLLYRNWNSHFCQTNTESSL